MSCFLCGHEEEDRHHLGCACIARPKLTEKEAVAEGLVAPPTAVNPPPEPKVEVLKEGSMTTVPETRGPEGSTQTCALEGCDNPRIDHPRAKYCEDHKDPKNRKE